MFSNWLEFFKLVSKIYDLLSIDKTLLNTMRADLVTGDPEGKKFSCYSKLNCKGIPPPWIP
jgi:hypothetical protein